VLGGLLALISAATFAWTNAAVRRGVRSGTVTQATSLSIPTGGPIFFAALLLTGRPGVIFDLPRVSVIVFAVVGVTHFCFGRYCNYRALNAIGTNLAGPVMQFNLVVSLAIAIVFLGETLTGLRIVGILLIVAGPAIVSRDRAPKKPVAAAAGFAPRLVEGYLFAFLAALFYGASPPLVRFAANGQGLAAALAGGVIASLSATAFTGLTLFFPGRWRDLRAVNREAAKWFMTSGMMVYVSQIFAYMAVSIAPVTVTAPIIALNNVFRIHLSRWLNPEHEVFGPKILVGTVVSFLGVVVISLSLDALPLPAFMAPLLAWRWP